MSLANLSRICLNNLLMTYLFRKILCNCLSLMTASLLMHHITLIHLHPRLSTDLTIKHRTCLRAHVIGLRQHVLLPYHRLTIISYQRVLIRLYILNWIRRRMISRVLKRVILALWSLRTHINWRKGLKM